MADHKYRSSVPFLKSQFLTHSKHTNSSFFHRSESLRSISFFLIPLFIISLYSLTPVPPSLHISFFSFSVSLLSFLFTLSISLFSSFFSLDFYKQWRQQPLFLTSIPNLNLIFLRSLLISAVFLLRFQSLKLCDPPVVILAEISGYVAAVLVSNCRNTSFNKLSVLICLSMVMFFLSIGWDNVDCFLILPIGDCFRVLRLLLPFFSGFLVYHERISLNWGTLKLLGKRRVRLISLFFSTLLLFIPVIFTCFFSREVDFSAIKRLFWPLICTVLFGVLLREICNDEKNPSCSTEIVITCLWSLIIGMAYSTNLSIFGFLACGFLLSIAAINLSRIHSNSSYESEAFWLDSVGIGGPIRQIMSERRSRKIALFLLINTSYMVVEFSVGFMSNSLGLISDACHMLFDCAALAIGLYASYISKLPSNNKFFYGRGRFEVLSGYVNAVFLVLVAAMIIIESFERILDPQEVSTGSLLAVSVGGLAVNIVGLIFFHEEHHHAHHHEHHAHHHEHHAHHHEHHDHHHEHRDHHHEHRDHHHEHRDHHHEHHDHHHERRDHHHERRDHHHEHRDHHHQDCIEDGTSAMTKFYSDHRHINDKNQHIDHNMEGIFLHVLADTMGSIGIVLSTLLIRFKGWVVADPACSIFISILIVSSVVPLLRNSAEILLQRVPRVHGVRIKSALDEVVKTKGVHGVHDVRVWSLTNTYVVGTVCLRVLEEGDIVMVKEKALKGLHDAGINDLTVQIACIS